MRIIVGTLLLLLPVAAKTASGDIVAGETVITSRAVQDITFFDGTPFNQTGQDITVFGVAGEGELRLERDAQSGTTINIPSLTGVFTGYNDLLGFSYEMGTLTPAGEAAFSGSIENVVLDEDDPGFASGDPSSFESGDYAVSGDFFEIRILDGPAAGAFFTTGAVNFTSQFDGLPPSAGTVINGGDEPVSIFFFDGTDTIEIGHSTNRRIYAVPEPSSVMVLGGLSCAALLLGRRRLRRRQASVASETN